jgi:DNA-binding LacI/PurR family transcriptional regulator
VRPRPTALLAAIDALTMGALHAARENGHVPADLSILGFDVHPRANPSLTTIRQSHADKGRRAGGLLLPLLSGDSGNPSRH